MSVTNVSINPIMMLNQSMPFEYRTPGLNAIANLTFGVFHSLITSKEINDAQMDNRIIVPIGKIEVNPSALFNLDQR